VRFGDLRRLEPIDPQFGYRRGLPVDRYYIEEFLARHADDIRGRVLEVGDNEYTMRFGGARVRRSDVFHVSDENPKATFVGDLARADDLPVDAFDCMILTQTLQFIFDVQAVFETLFRSLKPGGVLLLTVPGISQIDRGEWRDTWYWAFTTTSIMRLAGRRFGTDITVEARGNVLSAVAFLEGLAAEELTRDELDAHDRSYQVLITLRARKPCPAP
jgi:SAM-dependent methyltransferase